MTYDGICKDIQARKFAPVYVLMGEEPFFIDRITNLLIETVVEEPCRDFDQVILYGSDTNAATVINAAKRFPMMSPLQLVVIREAQQMKDLDLLVNYVKAPLRSTVLVLNYKYKPLDKRKSLALAVDKIGVLFDSKKIPDYKMPAYITSMLQLEGIGIDDKGAQMLADFLGNDLSRLHNEVEKLMLLLPAAGSRRVTPELIEENIGISKEYNNFELLKAIACKNVLKANRIIDHFEKNPKDNPIQVTLTVLFNYFANLLICHYACNKTEQGLMNELGLKAAFQLRDYQTGLRNFTAMKAFNLISDIRTTDARSKGVDNPSTSSAYLLKELLYRILH